MSDSSSHTSLHNRHAASSRTWREAAGLARRAAGARLFLLAAILILACSASALSMPLSEYRENVHKAAAELEGVVKGGQRGSTQERTDRMTSALNDVLQLVPLYKPVEWEGRQIIVDNTWLEDDFKVFQQLPYNSPQRAQILTNIVARLRAIEDRLKELDPRGAEPTVQAPANKAQEKAQLKKVLDRAEFNPKPPEKSIWQRIRDKLSEWWNSLFGGLSMGSGQGSWLSFIAMIVIFSLAGAVLAYAIWKVVLLIQGRKRKRKADELEARVILGERLAPDQKASDILAEAEALARKGELRAAIRKAYIALLCELGDRKVITLAQYKTNRDYLRAVRERRPLLNEMQKLTNSFENHWYGFRQATDNDWAAFRKGYDKVLSAEY